MNYCAKENCFCDFATERGYCHHSLCDHTQPTTTHSAGMEVEQEIELIDRCLESTKFRLFYKEQHFNEENEKCVRQKEVQRYIADLLKSRRDALISQQVIR